jgi:hypothetical protein
MKRIALILGLLLVGATTVPAAQTRFSVAVGFGAPSPYVSGFVVVGRPAPYLYYRPPYSYRPLYRRPALVVVERAPVFLGRRYHYRGYHPYRPVYACRPHFRCGF